MKHRQGDVKHAQQAFLFLWYLKVKVSDLFGVQVEDPVQDLLEELSGLLLAQRLLFSEEVEELAAGHTGQNTESEN